MLFFFFVSIVWMCGRILVNSVIVSFIAGAISGLYSQSISGWRVARRWSAGKRTSRRGWRWRRRAARSTWPRGRCCRTSPGSAGSRPPEDTSGPRGAAGREGGEAAEKGEKRKRKEKITKEIEHFVGHPLNDVTKPELPFTVWLVKRLLDCIEFWK